MLCPLKIIIEPKEGDARAHHNHVDVVADLTVIAGDRRGRAAMTLGVNMSVLDADVQVICHRILEAAANVPAPVPASARVGERAIEGGEHGRVDICPSAATRDEENHWPQAYPARPPAV